VFSNNGSLPVDRIDDMILRIMTPYYHLNQDAGFPQIDGYTPKLNFFPESAYTSNFSFGPIVDVRSEQHTKYASCACSTCRGNAC
jgi:beta-glucosidase